MLMATAQLSWNLWIDCPHCGETLDLSDPESFDQDGVISIPIFNNKWDNLEGREIECNSCHRSFDIENVEY